MEMLKRFRNFLMRGDVIVVAVGLVVALAFSNLVKAFTDNIINPLIASAQGGIKGPGLAWQLTSGGGNATYLNPVPSSPQSSTLSSSWRSCTS
jgi:large conductance mechanosensitive channel